jgi:hypothetical protein
VGGVLAKAENRFDEDVEPDFLELLVRLSLDLTGDFRGGVLPLTVIKSPQSMPFEDERRGGGTLWGSQWTEGPWISNPETLDQGPGGEGERCQLRVPKDISQLA